MRPFCRRRSSSSGGRDEGMGSARRWFGFACVMPHACASGARKLRFDGLLLARMARTAAPRGKAFASTLLRRTRVRGRALSSNRVVLLRA
jgi:hypothetical protein